MNALGISLVWTAVQVTLFCAVGAGLYTAARRRHPVCRVSVLCGTLTITAGIAALSLSPWPRWLPGPEARPKAQNEVFAARAAAERSPATALRSSNAATEPNAGSAFEADVNMSTFMASLWARFHEQLADQSPAQHGSDRWRWPAWLAAVLLSGMVLGLARVLLGITALIKMLRLTRPVDDAALLCLIDELRNRLNCRRTIEVREMTRSGGGSPAVIGWRRPVILLPADWRSWSEEAQRGILAHETAHVAHGDFLKWLAAQMGVIVHFYNPLVHWLAARLRLEQELAADACGAALSGGAKVYTTILAQMALGQDDFRPLWAGRPFFPVRGTLMRRIEMLRNQPLAIDQPPSRFWLAVLASVLLVVGLGVCGLRGPRATARADEPSTEKIATEVERSVHTHAAGDGLLPAFDDSYLPADTIAVVSVKPLRLAGSSVVIEPVLNYFPSSFGFAIAANDEATPREWQVEEVKTIVMTAARSEPSVPGDETEPSGVEIYRLLHPYEKNKLRYKLFGEAPDGMTETTCHGYPCLQATSDVSGLLVNYLLVDDRTFVIMRDRDVPCVLAADPKSHPSWYDEWRKLAGKPLAAGFDTAAMDKLDERAKGSAEDVFFSVLKNTTHLFGYVDSTTEGLLVAGKAHCRSSEAAAAASQQAKAALALAQMVIPQALAPSDLPKEYQPIDLGGPLVKALANLKIGVNDTRIDVEGKLDAGFVAPFAEATKTLIARQTEEYKAREPADNQAHVAKLGRLAEALNAYHTEHGHYPPAAVVGPDGKTLHSWRVELLPYLSEQELFDEYKLDEPWDSEHNKPLVQKIPSIYSTSVWTQKGDSDYFVVTGRGTLFDAAAPGRRESIADAPGETILVLASFQHVPWTKPVDVETTADHNAVRPFRGHGKGFYAAFADGTVKFVSKETDAASVRAMFTKAGRDQVKLR